MTDTFMRRALELARVPAATSPNPRVGAVLVTDGAVVGEGAHLGAGTPHAEAVALAAAGERARGATLYVTLEPCFHEGRMPPCAPAVVAAGVTHVVVAIEDPDSRVAGRGIAFLRDNGIEVTTGLLAASAAELNRAFLHQRKTGRTLITLKLASTLDGRLAAPDRSSRWITGEEARRFVHARRAEVDAVMVGVGTVVADDPQLTTREVSTDRQPVRIVVDASGRLPAWARVFDTGEVIVATTAEARSEAKVAWKDAGAEVMELPRAGRGVDLSALITSVSDRDWLEILCEGGAELATSLLKQDLVDRLELHHGPLTIGRGGPDIGDLGFNSMTDAQVWSLAHVDRLGDDVISVYDRKRV
ncbi:MAG TPA: bifunctional diaminohydroxyphosphoribosylaminopyrimidine deaminase/5-amino-6-(5-phosphoribosylamino)uracil reductase RibD [Actinomycetota bacterium]|nr:bifunctional diaminohydroxyphosphoribosylaminopyrimidine deaminase/5-amino-6-(5-phosphoribosylamino)uracil reductase RibD [Actinomycetota bacterium]